MGYDKFVRKIIFFCLFFILLTLFQSKSTYSYQPANNCRDLPQIPSSITPDIGTDKTEFKLNIEWTKLSNDDFKKYDNIPVYIRAYGLKDNNINIIGNTQDSDYGRIQEDKIYNLVFQSELGTSTIKVHLETENIANICSGYEATPLTITINNTQPTPTPAPQKCEKKGNTCEDSSNCRNGTPQCESFTCKITPNASLGICTDSNTPTPPQPTPTGSLTFGKICDPEQQTYPPYTCGNNTKCVKINNENRCANDISPQLEERCNASVNITDLAQCNPQTYKIIAKATRCGDSLKGFVCGDKKEVLCMNGDNSEDNVFCEKPRPIPPPCTQWVDLNGNPINPPDPDNPKEMENAKCGSINTAIGSINTDIGKAINQLFSIVLGLSGGIALILIIYSGYQLMMSQGNQEKVQGAKETLTSAIVGLLFIIFSLVILQVIGVDILKIPGFN